MPGEGGPLDDGTGFMRGLMIGTAIGFGIWLLIFGIAYLIVR